MRLNHFLMALALVVMWSIDFLGAKCLSDSYPAFFIVAVKFAICSCLLLPFHRTPPIPILHIGAMAFIYGLCHIGSWFLSVQLGIYLSTLAFIEILSTPISIVISAMFLKERLSKAATCGIILAFAGAIIVVFNPDMASADQDLWAIVAAMVSAVAWALYNAYVKQITKIYKAHSSFALIAWLSFCSCILSAMASLLFERDHFSHLHMPNGADSIAMLYNIFSALTFQCLLLLLLKHYTVSRISMFMLLVPFLSSAMANMVFHEPLYWSILMGGIMVCVGVGSALITSRDA